MTFQEKWCIFVLIFGPIVWFFSFLIPYAGILMVGFFLSLFVELDPPKKEF